MSGDHNMNQYRHKPWVGINRGGGGAGFSRYRYVPCRKQTLYHSIARAIEAKLKEKKPWLS